MNRSMNSTEFPFLASRPGYGVSGQVMAIKPKRSPRAVVENPASIEAGADLAEKLRNF
jgi:hypothetical protein